MKLATYGEHQRGRERRGRARVDDVHPQLARRDLPQQPRQRRQVEDVAQALAIRLEDHRERPVARGHRQQVGRPLALGPQRRALAREPSRQQQRPRGVLAEARREHAPVPRLATTRSSISSGGTAAGRPRAAHRRPGTRSTIPSSDHIVSISAPAVLAQPRRDRHGPRRVHAGAEGRQQAHAIVADLVEVALDDDRLIARHLAGRLGLLAQILPQVLRGALVEAVLLVQLRDRLRLAALGDLPRQRADGAPERDRPPRVDRRARTASCPAARARATRARGRA